MAERGLVFLYLQREMFVREEVKRVYFTGVDVHTLCNGMRKVKPRKKG